ncbi:MAG: co-chaperone YbbN [Candidatus Nanopelagicaceae bacterium]
MSTNLPRNFGRAFDLSTLKQPATPPSTSSAALEVTPTNVMSDFVAHSKTEPVVLLAWSSRMPESKTVLTHLDELAAADKSWRLGSVNLDKYPELAQALQVQAIPFALALIQEQGVPLFDAPHPKEQIRLVINKVLELAAQKGMTVKDASGTPLPSEPKMEPEEEEAVSALEKGDYSSAAAAYKKWLARRPGETLAQIGLAQCELMMRINNLDPKKVLAEAASEHNNLTLQIQAADIEVATGAYENAFNRLIKCVKTMDADEKKKAKDHLLVLFTLVDPTDPILIKARSALASALF